MSYIDVLRLERKVRAKLGNEEATALWNTTFGMRQPYDLTGEERVQARDLLEDALANSATAAPVR